MTFGFSDLQDDFMVGIAVGNFESVLAEAKWVAEAYVIKTYHGIE